MMVAIIAVADHRVVGREPGDERGDAEEEHHQPMAKERRVTGPLRELGGHEEGALAILERHLRDRSVSGGVGQAPEHHQVGEARRERARDGQPREEDHEPARVRVDGGGDQELRLVLGPRTKVPHRLTKKGSLCREREHRRIIEPDDAEEESRPSWPRPSPTERPAAAVQVAIDNREDDDAKDATRG